MGLTIGNPWGLIGLLAIPLIILVHFFQRKSRRIPVSTLFLIPEEREDTRTGRRFERLQNTLPLWLQILSALLITWLLIEPMWLREDSRQRVVFVVDSSMSMEAFESRLLAALNRATDKLEEAAAETDYYLLESDSAGGSIYKGERGRELMAALDRWEPTLGAHDMEQALRSGRALAGENGRLILLTDHDYSSRVNGVEVLAVGEKLQNWGFAGVRVTTEEGQPMWTALVRNHGDATATRKWWMEGAASRSGDREMTLRPGQIMSIKGGFPEGEDSVLLRLEDDGFEVDNHVPLVRPRLKTLVARLEGEPKITEFIQRVVDALPQASLVGNAPSVDLVFDVGTNAGIFEEPVSRIYFYEPGGEAPTSEGVITAPIVSEDHPLVAELTFSGLLLTERGPLVPDAADQVLAWQGEEALIYLRKRGEVEDLVFNFSPLETFSNANRVPAVILLMHRFAERVRAAKIASERRNYESSQLIPLQLAPDAPLTGTMVLKGPLAEGTLPVDLRYLPAPRRPAFFEVRQGEEVLTEGAAYFADSRESQFTGAKSTELDDAVQAAIVESNSERDFLAPLWMVLIAIFLLWSWHHQGRPEENANPAAARKQPA